MTPLCFANPSPPSGWIGDFHPQAIEHAGHTTKPLRGNLWPEEGFGEHTDRTPHRTVDGVRHDRVEAAEIHWSFCGSIGWSGSTWASRLPLRWVSSTNALQPSAFTASPSQTRG